MNLVHLPWPVEMLFGIALLAILSSAGIGLFQSLRLTSYTRRLAEGHGEPSLVPIVNAALDNQTAVLRFAALSPREIGISREALIVADMASFRSARRMLFRIQLSAVTLAALGLAALGWPYLLAGSLMFGLLGTIPLSQSAMSSVHTELASLALQFHAWRDESPADFGDFVMKSRNSQAPIIRRVSDAVAAYRVSASAEPSHSTTSASPAVERPDRPVITAIVQSTWDSLRPFEADATLCGAIDTDLVETIVRLLSEFVANPDEAHLSELLEAMDEALEELERFHENLHRDLATYHSSLVAHVARVRQEIDYEAFEAAREKLQVASALLASITELDGLG